MRDSVLSRGTRWTDEGREPNTIDPGTCSGNSLSDGGELFLVVRKQKFELEPKHNTIESQSSSSESQCGMFRSLYGCGFLCAFSFHFFLFGARGNIDSPFTTRPTGTKSKELVRHQRKKKKIKTRRNECWKKNWTRRTRVLGEMKNRTRNGINIESKVKELFTFMILCDYISLMLDSLVAWLAKRILHTLRIIQKNTTQSSSKRVRYWQAVDCGGKTLEKKVLRVTDDEVWHVIFWLLTRSPVVLQPKKVISSVDLVVWRTNREFSVARSPMLIMLNRLQCNFNFTPNHLVFHSPAYFHISTFIPSDKNWT